LDELLNAIGPEGIDKVKKSKIPPKFLETFLQALLSIKDRESLLGDFNEMYVRISNKGGVIRALCWYFFHIFKLIPAYVESKIYWSLIMIKNYLKTAVRNLKNDKVYSVINISGLAIGMACTILILLWVQYELSFDRFHNNAGRIYRVSAHYHDPDDFGRYLPGPLAAYLKEGYPEILDATSYKPMTMKLTVDNRSFFSQGSYVEPSFLKIFSFPLLKGDAETIFLDPYSIVITDELAKKFFGQENPVGKTMTFMGVDVKVTGVIKNIPKNSHLQFDFLVPYEIGFYSMRIWSNNSVFSYVKLAEHADSHAVSQKISDVAKKHRQNCNYDLFLHPLAKIHLYALGGGGQITYVYIFTIMAVFVLLIASINFMNLSTARAEKRFKEIGVKKVLGSSRPQLIKQFLSESILHSFIALFLALFLAALLIPSVNSILNTPLKLNFSLMWICSFIGIALLTGVFSGSYPALYLSGFRPLAVLKGPFGSRSKVRSRATILRKALVVMQFSLSIFFIIGILVITRQMNYIRTINLGYDKDYLVVVKTSGELRKNIQVIKNELLENPSILNATVSMMSLVDWESAVTDRHLSWTGKSGEYSFTMGQNFVDYDFLDTLKLQMAQGRFFSREFLSDPREACVVNEAAVKAMRMDEPLGKKFYINAGTDSERSKTIIGVVKDFNTQSLHKEIRPFWWEFTNSGSYLCLKLQGRSTSASLKFIENKIKEFIPDDPFSYYFLDDKLNSLYQTEQLTRSLTRYITFLAVFISCLGLFGLASFSVERRTKEIGIRKVLGSSSSQVVLLLTKEFTKWVLMANVLAWPAAYFAVNLWLKNFAFKTAISVWIFLLAAGLSLLIALITVSFQSIRAATANPVDSLRYE